MQTNRFKTLLQREWMQHHKGWLAVMLVPPLLFLLMLPFGQVQTGPDFPTPMLALAATAISTCVVFGLSWSVVLLQLPGLARRDQQDRSIEFWRSLPAGHAESLGATLLAHTLLVPLLALAVGSILGLPIAAAVVLKVGGFAAIGQVPWVSVATTVLFGVLRLALGLLLASLWLAPVAMAAMAASAWLKRWGVPVLIGAVAVAGGLMAKLYGNDLIFRLVHDQFEGSSRALFNAERLNTQVKGYEGVNAVINQFGSWVVHDLAVAVGQLASPNLIGGLLVAAGGFYLLVLRRGRVA